MAIKQAAKQTKHMQVIRCKTTLFTIGSWLILRLPEEASAQIPTRGQVMVEGTINGVHFQSPLEPDGKWSHWFRITDSLQKAAQVKSGDTVAVEFTVTPNKLWPEPDVPAGWQKALAAHPRAQELWQKVTPMARWEWIRWARATSNDETRQRRIEVGMSKLEAGERRPCCWNRNMCTEPSVSKSGVLLEPTDASK